MSRIGFFPVSAVLSHLCLLLPSCCVSCWGRALGPRLLVRHHTQFVLLLPQSHASTLLERPVLSTCPFPPPACGVGPGAALTGPATVLLSESRRGLPPGPALLQVGLRIFPTTHEAAGGDTQAESTWNYGMSRPAEAAASAGATATPGRCVASRCSARSRRPSS